MPKDYVNPLGMLNNAKIWNELYKQNINNRDLNRQMVAIYCLLVSIEMHLKAYLIFLDNLFGEERYLKKLGHNFKSLYNNLEKRAPKDFSQKVKKLFTNYKLFIQDFSILRYPKEGDLFWVNKSLWNQNKHGFDEIFNFISEEINKNSSF